MPLMQLISLSAIASAAIALNSSQPLHTLTNGRSANPIQTAKSMVLTSRQAGDGFSQIQSEGFTPAQLVGQNTWTAAQLAAWGYRGGYERVFDREVGDDQDEQVASNAGVYRSSRGAQESLIADGNECTTNNWQALSSPKHLGDDSVLCTRPGSAAGLDGRLYFLVWRTGRFKGSITVTGIAGHVIASRAIQLARVQEQGM